MKFRCLLCNKTVSAKMVSQHKTAHHNEYRHYGMMWQVGGNNDKTLSNSKSRVIACPTIAKMVGVSMLYILNEGFNPSGSMKDYLTTRAVSLGGRQGYKWYTVVSSGNQAVSLALAAQKVGGKVIIFVPASSHKIDFLCSFPNTLVFGVEDSVFEDVYTQYGLFSESLPGIYNANVCNEFLLAGLSDVWTATKRLSPFPTHVLSGVGNGSYLAGFYWGISQTKTKHMPKIIPVGMKGGFPTETAIRKGQSICEYKDFRVPESLIDAAEGSIAIGSYSMPQLVYSVVQTQGFPAGGLLNDDLAVAYEAILQEKELLSAGAIPEPTGILGLASLLKNKKLFPKSSHPMAVFTGHAVKDLDTVLRITDSKIGQEIRRLAKNSAGDLEVSNNQPDETRLHILPKKGGLEQAVEIVKSAMEESE